MGPYVLIVSRGSHLSSKRIVRLLQAAALLAALVPAPTPAAASWPGGNGDIFVVAEEGTPIERRIDRFSPAGQQTGGAGSDLTQFSNIATSAHGSRLAYSKNGDIVLVELDTFEESTVVTGLANEIDPAFSYDGRYLYYVSDADNDQDIYVRDLQNPSAQPVNLTNNTVDDWAPAYANDGTDHGELIAYVTLQGLDTEIYTMTPTGDQKTPLTDTSKNEFGPNWHPDFDMLAYSSQDESGRDQIFTMGFDGTGKDQLTSDEFYNYEPAWSPDGTKIAFTKQGVGAAQLGRIFVRSASPGGTETPVTPEGSVNYDRAEWQAEPGGGAEPVKPALFFSLSKHLTVKGGVDGPHDSTGGTCGVGTRITIQRRVAGRWRKVANVTTNQNGTFSRQVPDKTGSYRLRSAAFTDEANETECLASTTAAKTHSHR